jgi:hypothetical protein
MKLWIVVLAICLEPAMVCAGPGSPQRFTQSQSDYILACAGCHGLRGASNGLLVPDLKGLVGYYLMLPEGKSYLSRLPNVAFSSMDDRRLAELLNYMVFDIGGGSAPPWARPFEPAEVGKWRKEPLTDVALSKYRRRLVETLISQYQAPESLRFYGQDMYN